MYNGEILTEFSDDAEFDLHCPYCAKLLVAQIRLVGTVEACPICKNPILIPNPFQMVDKSQEHLSPIGRVINVITIGKYQDFCSLPETKCHEMLKLLSDSINYAHKDKLQNLKKVKSEIKYLWNEFKKRQDSTLLQNHNTNELLKLNGVGPTTIKKLHQFGVDNLADLANNLIVLQTIPRVSVEARSNIMDYVTNVIKDIKNTIPTIKGKNESEQRLILLALALEHYSNSVNELSLGRKRLLKIKKKFSHISFLSFLLGHSSKFDTKTVQAFFKEYYFVKEYLLHNDKYFSKNFIDLSTDEFIRGQGLLQKANVQISNISCDKSKVFGTQANLKLIEKINAISLDTSLMTNCIIREYQEFGAKFIIAQKQVLLGDEMGLGKTIQALATMCHLAKCKKSKFYVLIIVPATLRENWRIEITNKTCFIPYILTGVPSQRKDMINEWKSNGGIGVISYSTLNFDLDLLLDVPYLDFIVADEAQYIKNINSMRTENTRKLFSIAETAVLMTGTPIENSPKEFAVICNALSHNIDHLYQMELGRVAGRPENFKKDVESIYLRRNKNDVLQELPELIEIENWLEMNVHELKEHETILNNTQALWSGIMELRKHAIWTKNTGESIKLNYACDLISQYRKDGVNIVVFSFFRKVLADLGEANKDAYFIHGGIPPSKRNMIIDNFSNQTTQGRGNLLLSQINAGGLGLNIQAASAAIIIEPQFNPAIEHQAICRLHRMGQRNSVNVHRLLMKGTVEEGLHKMLIEKRKYMDLYARDSALKESSPDAISSKDISIVLNYTKEMINQHCS
jgi:SNF2 family DNA or RNA helicase